MVAGLPKGKFSLTGFFLFLSVYFFSIFPNNIQIVEIKLSAMCKEFIPFISFNQLKETKQRKSRPS